MAKILEMPKLSPTMEEGVLSMWHKKEGESILVDDLLAEVETDKATMEFRAFDKGVILKILVAPGSQVKLGQPVAVVGVLGEDISSLLARIGRAETPAPPPQDLSAATEPSASVEQRTAEMGGSGARPSSDTLPPPGMRNPPTIEVLDRTSHLPRPVEGRPAIDRGRVIASPRVRQLARELGIDLQGALGTGPGGRVTADDLEKLRNQTTSPLARVGAGAPSESLARDAAELRPLSPMRKTIARRLVESKTTIPHFYLSIDVDAMALVSLKEKINADLASSPSPSKVSLNDLFIKACGVALKRVPDCNASYTPDAIRIHSRVDISIAVAIPDGLVTPVIRDVDRKTLVSVAAEVRELAARARARKLKPEEMQDGTFSITNLGMFGVDSFSAVINPPEAAILAIGAVRDVPVVTEGAVVPGKRIQLTLSCDHRVVDGATGAAFLSELRQLIEHPMRTLTG